MSYTEELTETKEALRDLNQKLEAFMVQYDLDMRGDSRLDNGETGVIGNLRELKKLVSEYPSLSYWIAHNQWKALSVILGFFTTVLGISAASHLLLTIPPVAQFLADLLGIPIPVIAPHN